MEISNMTKIYNSIYYQFVPGTAELGMLAGIHSKSKILE